MSLLPLVLVAVGLAGLIWSTIFLGVLALRWATRRVGLAATPANDVEHPALAALRHRTPAKTCDGVEGTCWQTYTKAEWNQLPLIDRYREPTEVGEATIDVRGCRRCGHRLELDVSGELDTFPALYEIPGRAVDPDAWVRCPSCQAPQPHDRTRCSCGSSLVGAEPFVKSRPRVA